MISNSPYNIDAEPTAEFNEHCLSVVTRWEKGDLPFTDALAEMTALREKALAEGHLANQGRVEHLLGYINGFLGNLNTSIHHYERARALFTQVGNRNRTATCDLNMGEDYRYKGDFNRARALYEKAYETFKELGDREAEAMAIANRGRMFLSTGQIEHAYADLEASYRIAAELPPEAENRGALLCEIHDGLALIHLINGNIESAWNEAQQAFQIAQENQQPFEIGFANRTIAEVVSAMDTAPDNGFQNDPDVYYQAANEAFREINAEGEMARTMFVHAKSLAHRGRKMTAARKLQLAMIIFTRLGMVDDAAKAAEAQLEVL